MKPPSDLLYRSNCHVERSLAVGSLLFTYLCIAGNSCRSERFTPLTLEYKRKLKSSQINGKRISRCACIASFSA